MSAPLVAVVSGRGRRGARSGRPGGASTRRRCGPRRPSSSATWAAPRRCRRCLGALAWSGATPASQALVRAFAAESLGRLRATQAVEPLSAALGQGARPRRCGIATPTRWSASARPRPCRRCAGRPGRAPSRERIGALQALSQLGGEADRPLFEAAQALCADGCPAPARKARWPAWWPASRRPRACAGDARLLDRQAGRRPGRGAGSGRARGGARRRRGAGGRPPGGGGAGRSPPTPSWRRATRRCWRSTPSIAARPSARRGRRSPSAIDRMVAGDKGRTLTAGVDEDALRLSARLRRGAR